MRKQPSKPSTSPSISAQSESRAGGEPGKLVTQRQLLQQVWGLQYEKETNYLRVYLAQIRQKLEPDPARPRYFITEARMGYRFEPSDAGR
jgi:DNA-binding response OmpR family regulator